MVVVLLPLSLLMHEGEAFDNPGGGGGGGGAVVAAVDDEYGVQWRRGGGVQWRRQRLMEATQQPTTRCATGG